MVVNIAENDNIRQCLYMSKQKNNALPDKKPTLPMAVTGKVLICGRFFEHKRDPFISWLAGRARVFEVKRVSPINSGHFRLLVVARWEGCFEVINSGQNTYSDPFGHLFGKAKPRID